MDLKNLLKPKIIIGLILVIALLNIVFIQYRFKEKIFPAGGGSAFGGKKAAPKKEKTLMVGGEAIPQEPILVKVYKTKKGDFDDSLPLLGTLRGFKEIDLKFETSGIVDSFNFKEGERVEEGEIIATVNQKDALLKLKYNEIEFEKIQKLFDIGAVAKAKLEQVRLELESAKRELDKTYLYAPRNGVIGTKDAEVGEFVTYSDKVATLIDDKEVFAELGIVERDIGRIRVGQRGRVTVDTYPDVEFEGVVDTVSPVVEGKSRTQTAKLKVKNPKRALVPGMFARALVAVYSAKDIITIPNAAIDKTEEGYVTYVVKKVEEQDIVEARPIEADYRSADFFVLRSGLEEGELVVVETQEKLKNGYKVIVAETQEALF